MEVIKRKICLEDLITRESGDNYGSLTATSIYVKVMLTQDIDDQGMFMDADFSASTDSKTAEDFYSNSNAIIEGYSTSRINELKTYNRLTPFNPNIINDNTVYIDYKGDSIDGVSKVLSVDNITAYTFNAENDGLIGTENQETGILYRDYEEISSMRYKSEGWNMTNTSYSGLVKNEIMFGVVAEPEVYSDVFIDRGNTTVFEPHLRLAEIESVEHLALYGNGYYNIIK